MMIFFPNFYLPILYSQKKHTGNNIADSAV